MQRPLRKHITSLLFLAAFLIPRVAELHVLEHLSEEEEAISCELCDIVSPSQQLDLSTVAVSYEQKQLIPHPSEHIVYGMYHSPLAKIFSPTSVYNKPPPRF